MYFLLLLVQTVESGQLSRYSDGLQVRRPGFDSRQGPDFSLLHRIETGYRAHPASYPMGTWGSFPGVMGPGREAEHSPQSSVEVKNGGAVHPLTHVFMAQCLIH
jgi:hypothetical protein